MKILKVIKWILNIKEKELGYPYEFALIEYSPVALSNNILDDQNKIIYHYFHDEMGNVVVKKLRYSPARVISMQEVHSIPVYDKTKQEIKFPVFSTILPSEVVYTTK